VAGGTTLLIQIYTSGKTLPTPFARATYYHRSLDPKKLIDIKFSALQPGQTLAMVKKLYSVPEELTIPELRPMSKNDVFGVAKLLNEGLSYSFPHPASSW
jgi:glycylpeptide N-tetradecanoyltransferase